MIIMNLLNINSLNMNKVKMNRVNIDKNDSEIVKNIIDVLFTFINNSVNNDREMSGFTKSLILEQLPKIATGSKNYTNKVNSSDIKKLLDDIQIQLNKR